MTDVKQEIYFNVEAGNDYMRGRNVADRGMKRAERRTEKRDGSVLRKEYRLPLDHGELSVSVTEQEITPQISRVSTEVTARGTGDGALLNGVASLYYQGIPLDGEWWSDTSRFSVFVCRNAWCGEGQWDEKSLKDLGLYPSRFATARIESFGTWTTGTTHPFMVLCDKKRNLSWCIEPEFTAGRYLEIGYEKTANGNFLYLYVASANERCGWHKTLKDGETYRAEPIAFGMVEGGFEQAVAAMTEYRRKTSLVSWERGVAPLCFNDYMNCLWARPSKEKLLPLIDAASDAGCEIFCIDAGWFGDWHDPAIGRNGTWEPNDAPFGEGGLQSVLDRIRERGMIPGLWLELESVLGGSPYFREHPEALATRHGVKINRDFPDFRLASVREYFTGQIDALCAMGVGYFKNDYNASMSAGCDPISGETLQDGAREYINAFLSFIDETLERHPGLIIENCGSGAMRSDNHTLAHFALQSTSDQEWYGRMPSILQGSLAQMPPEKAGVWAYPYALPSSRHHEDPASAVTCDDAELTFNLAAACFGCMYLSGHIELATGDAKKRLREGTDFYKHVREWTCRATAVYPNGFGHIDEDETVTVGLQSKKDKKLLIGVFSIRSEAREITVDLSKYCRDFRICASFADRDVTVDRTGTLLTFTVPKGTHAAVAELEF